ncbi:MAG: PTS sugar transporter subunit IIB [Elusimicrobiota bacterium]
MALALLRIDDRLIHGQVVEGWMPALKARRVVVISDEAAGDPTQTALMRMCMPETVALEICSLADAPAALSRAAAAPENVLALVPGPAEVLSLLRAGVRVESVNVGGLHYAAGRMQLGKAMFLSEADIRALRDIAGAGVRLEGRAVPSDTPEDVSALIREKD